MTEGVQQILQHLFGADRLEEVSIDQIKELVDEYPSFNAGHYLLSRKLQEEKDDTYQHETQRTVLYFNNPFWLQWLLQSNGEEQPKETEMIFSSEQKTEPGEMPTDTFLYKEEVMSAAPDQINGMLADAHPETIEIDQTTTAAFSNATDEEQVAQSLAPGIYETDQTSEINEMQSLHFEQKEETYAETADFEKEITHEADQPEILQTEQRIHEFHMDQDINDHLHEPKDSHMADRYPPQPEEAKLGNEIEQEIREQTNTGELRVENINPESVANIGQEEFNTEEIEPGPDANQAAVQLINEPTSEAPSSESLPFNQYGTQQTSHENQSSHEEEQQAESATSQPVEEFSVEQAIPEAVTFSSDQTNEIVETIRDNSTASQTEEPAKLSEAATPTDSPEEPSADQLVFEPYHTIDYFASLGIKLVLEENPTDRFGKQLKSFTDWLKIMKKLPQIPVSEEPDDQADAQIQRIAARSIEEKDTITETMAEVLAKQEKYDKAIDVYLQLSLLNPTKIAYFAAKIEQLKKEQQ